MEFFIWLIVVGIMVIVAWKMPDDRDRTGGKYKSCMDDYM